MVFPVPMKLPFELYQLTVHCEQTLAAVNATVVQVTVALALTEGGVAAGNVVASTWFDEGLLQAPLDTVQV